MSTIPSKRRERLWIYGLVVVACTVGFVAHVSGLAQQAAVLVRNEDAARARLLDVVEAQARHQARTGRFGTLEELAGAGDLGTETVRPGPDGVPCLAEAGYRIDVLLPDRRAGEGRVFLVIGSEGEIHADLRKKHFAAVARPLAPAKSGFRTLYVDETGQVFVSEGVSDEPSRATNPLPRVHLSSGTPREPLGLVWMRWEDIEAQWKGR